MPTILLRGTKASFRRSDGGAVLKASHTAVRWVGYCESDCWTRVFQGILHGSVVGGMQLRKSESHSGS